DQALLGNRHGARQRHDDEALFVTSNGLEHVSRFPELASGERGLRHGAYQIVDRPDLAEIERLQRNQPVFNGVVQLAVDARSVVVVSVAVLFSMAVLIMISLLHTYLQAEPVRVQDILY